MRAPLEHRLGCTLDDDLAPGLPADDQDGGQAALVVEGLGSQPLSLSLAERGRRRSVPQRAVELVTADNLPIRADGFVAQQTGLQYVI